MANRYSVADGNWSSTSTWSSTLGGSPGASVPTASDDVIITSSKSVTIDVDAEAFSITFSSGTLTISGSNSLSIYDFFIAAGGNSKTLNLNAGEVFVNGQFSLSSNTTLNAGTSTILILPSAEQSFTTSSKEFNDVFIFFQNDEAIEYTILGSPTFRSLVIKSIDGQANTVNFDSGATINVDKLIAIGSSSSNKLTIQSVGSNSTTNIAFPYHGTCYGQYVNVLDQGAYAVVSYRRGEGYYFPQAYIGSTSTNNGNDTWLLQDPPKMSTLVDPLTTAPASNTRWSYTGSVASDHFEQRYNGLGGGGYRFKTIGPGDPA